MPETVQPDADHEQDAPEQSEDAVADQGVSQEEAQGTIGPEEIQAAAPAAAKNIIWTPTFLLAFALTLVLGLSADSLLAASWANKLLTGFGAWLILAHVILAALGWLLLGIVTRSRWIRTGCIFGGLCSAFLALNIFASINGVDPGMPVQAYMNVAACMALAGAYIGLSIEGTLLSTWDTWLFFLVPILSAVGVTLVYLLTPQASILTTENAVAAAAMIACVLFWWARPSCWKVRRGPTFIFGIVPAILLALALANASLHSFFLLQVLAPRISTYGNQSNFFFAQFVLFCLFLGCMRMAKSEIHN